MSFSTFYQNSGFLTTYLESRSLHLHLATLCGWEEGLHGDRALLVAHLQSRRPVCNNSCRRLSEPRRPLRQRAGKEDLARACYNLWWLAGSFATLDHQHVLAPCPLIQFHRDKEENCATLISQALRSHRQNVFCLSARGAAAPQLRHSRKGVWSPIESVILSPSSTCPPYLSSPYSLDSFCSSFQERDLADSISWEAVAFALLPDTTSARGRPDHQWDFVFRLLKLERSVWKS